MLKTNKYAQDIRVTVEKKTRASYKPSDEHDQTKSMCPNDGYLVIYNSELICGTLDKGVAGGCCLLGVVCLFVCLLGVVCLLFCLFFLYCLLVVFYCFACLTVWLFGCLLLFLLFG